MAIFHFKLKNKITKLQLKTSTTHDTKNIVAQTYIRTLLLVAPKTPKITFARQHIRHIRCSHAIYCRAGCNGHRISRHMCVQRVSTDADCQTSRQAACHWRCTQQCRVILRGRTHAATDAATATTSLACILLKSIPISHEHYLQRYSLVDCAIYAPLRFGCVMDTRAKMLW